MWYQIREEATQTIFEYIEVFCYRERIHSANDNLANARLE